MKKVVEVRRDMSEDEIAQAVADELGGAQVLVADFALSGDYVRDADRQYGQVGAVGHRTWEAAERWADGSQVVAVLDSGQDEQDGEWVPRLSVAAWHMEYEGGGEDAAASIGNEIEVELVWEEDEEEEDEEEEDEE